MSALDSAPSAAPITVVVAAKRQQRTVEANALATKTADTARSGFSKFTRTAIVSLFFGSLMGVSVPASPIFYKTFQGSTSAQVRIITQFAAVGAVFSALPYAVLLDNASSSGGGVLSPQFHSIFSPIVIGVSCWLGGHIWYPGHFILLFEKKEKRLSEFLRLTAKTALALHRIHLPFMVVWSVAFGIACKPFREEKANDKKEVVAIEKKK